MNECDKILVNKVKPHRYISEQFVTSSLIHTGVVPAFISDTTFHAFLIDTSIRAFLFDT
jgi:hypothetical protein